MRVVALVCCVTVGTALADPTPNDAFAQAEAKFAAGDKAAACPLYEQALAGEAQLPWKNAFLASTKLALCKRDANKIASAAALYRHAAEVLHKNSTTADNRQREQAAQKAADELTGKVSQLTIAAAKVDGLHVTLDGNEVEPGKALEVDGGTHVVRASATGRSAFEQSIVVADQKDAKTVEVAFAQAEPPKPTPAPARVSSTSTPKRNILPSLIAGGVAVAAGGVAIGFELAAESGYKQYKADPAQTDLLDAANGKRHIADAFAIGAVVAAGGAVALWFLWPAAAEHDRVSLVPVLHRELVGAQATMRW